MDEDTALPLKELLTLAKPLGFALLGVAEAKPTARPGFVRDWLGTGRHGEMGYLAQHVDKRLDPRALLPGARSIICAADQYAHADPQVQDEPKTSGRIARYAWGDDYHKVLKKRLHKLADLLSAQFPQATFKTAVDTAPVMEREHAQRAGLGWTGKHTLLIHPQRGSYLLLGEIITTLAVEPTGESITDHCGSCTRCIDACPTQCIEPYALDATRCISYLTLEHRSAIDADLHEAMGDWVAGCDVCQEVCPYNQAARLETHGVKPSQVAYEPRAPGPRVALLELLEWNAEARSRAFTRSALKRIKLDMLKRNALIAAGNYLRQHNDAALRQRVQNIAQDEAEAEMVRKTARQVLRDDK